MLSLKIAELLILAVAINISQSSAANSLEHDGDWMQCTRQPCATQLRDPRRGWIDDAVVHIDDIWWQLKDTLRTLTEKTGEFASSAVAVVQDAERREEVYTAIFSSLDVVRLQEQLNSTARVVTRKTGQFVEMALEAVKDSQRRRELFAIVSNSLNEQLSEIYRYPWIEKAIRFPNRLGHCLLRAGGRLRVAAGEIRDIFIEEFKH